MVHGGDIYSNNVRYDFSINVNPLGIPEKVCDILDNIKSDIVCYPDYESFELREKLANYYNLSIKNVLCGNGASELFMAAVHAVTPRKALLPAPSFYGYIHALKAVNADIIYYHLDEKKDFILDDGILDFIEKQSDIDMIFIANPNNPVGNIIDNDLLDRLLFKCKEKGIVIIIDECFMELSGSFKKTKSGLPDMWDNLLIIRAFTKTFAMPGLRLGYMLGSDEKLLLKIRKQLPEWNVSLPAQKAGASVLDSVHYLEAARTLIENERRYLVKELASMGIKVYPSDTNFIMIKTALPLYDTLLKKEILIRDCSDFEGLCEGFYRIAVKKHEENEILIDAVKSILLG